MDIMFIGHGVLLLLDKIFNACALYRLYNGNGRFSDLHT